MCCGGENKGPPGKGQDVAGATVAPWCSGNTSAFGAEVPGSNPGGVAKSEITTGINISSRLLRRSILMAPWLQDSGIPGEQCSTLDLAVMMRLTADFQEPIKSGGKNPMSPMSGISVGPELQDHLTPLAKGTC